ncbi:hypothetical protein Taro_032775 [Colocasia esculenta]|uniref:DNA-binding protein BIN4 n=1 Tax=Colocasia esculenta TaxID=4460 RepID=A0A843VS62_COLES|nr:hypothetical protein [Colocasia esculenta]
MGGDDSREGSPDWMRSFQAPAARSSLLYLSSDSDSSPNNSPTKGKDVTNHEEEAVPSTVQRLSEDAILIDSGDEKPENLAKEVGKVEKRKSPKKAGKQTTPKKTGKQTTPKKSGKQAKDEDMEEEGGDVHEEPADEGAPEKPVVSNVSSRLPLVLSDKVQRSKALIECDGESVDLSGDVGAVGRIVISNTAGGNDEMLLDLKGTIYQSTIVPSRTFCIVSFGQTEAKIEAIMNDFVQLKPHSTVFEAETMIEGTLDGFSFDMEDEGERIPKSSVSKGDQNDKVGDHADERSSGKPEKSQGVKRKKATVAAKPPKKVARKAQGSRKAKRTKK